MDNNKDLEEANKEVERSKVIFHNTENSDDKKGSEVEEVKNDAKEEEGSGIFTVDGKELPKIDGGYDLIDPGGNLGDDELTSV
ncbi:MAG: hypothetical protein JWQ09_3246 [Segetibacter sp.]|nr:hypothetical protein [Segetibacter sp.]